ncbi:MAG: O-antigen ligase family protein [Acidobacteriia bacterium]|nr:O-antigen ligase family protein [Terriglobia bacterium]
MKLLPFRSRLIHPVPGWLPGESFTALLLALPFACAAAAYPWRKQSLPYRRVGAVVALLPTIVIVSGLCLSLSRAVFWSTVLFLIVTCSLMTAYRLVSVKAGSALLASSFAGLVVVLTVASAFYPGIFKAYLGRQVSQVRSTQGRTVIWSHSLELVRSHPFWGVGSSNAALFLLSSADEQDTTGFASRSFSLPVQILVEKGIIGFALYAAFLILVAREFHKSMKSGPAQSKLSSTREGPGSRASRKSAEDSRLESQIAGKATNCGFAAGIIAVLFRELMYSSLFEHTLTLSLFMALVALVCRREQ